MGRGNERAGMLLCHGTQCLVSRPSLGTNSIFWPPANAADPAQVSSCRLQGWMLHGCGCKLRAAMLQADRLHGCKLRGCRLQGFRLQVVRLQAAGDMLRIASLQAPGPKSECGMLSRFDMQKTKHISRASSCGGQNSAWTEVKLVYSASQLVTFRFVAPHFIWGLGWGGPGPI